MQSALQDCEEWRPEIKVLSHPALLRPMSSQSLMPKRRKKLILVRKGIKSDDSESVEPCSQLFFLLFSFVSIVSGVGECHLTWKRRAPSEKPREPLFRCEVHDVIAYSEVYGGGPEPKTCSSIACALTCMFTCPACEEFIPETLSLARTTLSCLRRGLRGLSGHTYSTAILIERL